MQHLIYRLSQGLKRNSRLYLLLTRIKYKRLTGDGNEDGQKKKSVGLITPPPPIKKTLHVSTLFLCISFRCCFFARLQLETSRNFLVTHFMEEMSYVLLFTFFFSLPLIFSLVDARISHFLIRCYKIPMFFFHRN